MALALFLVLGAACSYSDSSDDLVVVCVAGRSCTVPGEIGACSVGLTRCPDGPGGVAECAPIVAATDEVCDGADNDCDGSVDEGIPNQSEGTDVGLCRIRILACQMGGFQEIQSGIGPQPEICGDGLDQDCDGNDCSSPPVVTLVSPPSGSRLVGGASIEIAATASDADGIDRVEFFVDNSLEGTDSNAPYRIFYTVPFGVSEIGIEARAIDRVGLAATTGVERFPVDRNLATTVQGRVIDPRGDAVRRVIARIRGAVGLSDTTNGSGRFSIDAVPSNQGNIVVEVRLPPSLRLIGESDPTPPVSGGVTDVGTIVAATGFEDDDFGDDLRLGDDEAVRVSFASGFRFPFYGNTYSEMFVSSNGRLTFSSADDASVGSVAVFDDQPGIAPLFDDLDPDRGSGGVFLRQDGDRVVVTWDRVEVRRDRTVTFQVMLFETGAIQIGYLADEARDALVGITPGRSAISAVSDLSNAPPFTGGTGVMIYERFGAGGGEPFDLDGRFLLFAPRGADGYQVRALPLD